MPGVGTLEFRVCDRCYFYLCLLKAGSVPPNGEVQACPALAPGKHTLELLGRAFTCRRAGAGPTVPALRFHRAAWLAGHWRRAVPKQGLWHWASPARLHCDRCTQDRRVGQRQRLWIHPAGPKEHRWCSQ